MVFLILGASRSTSIGSMLGQQLKAEGHEVWLASRSGGYGVTCDIHRLEHVRAALAEKRPQVVIHAAGVWGDPRPLGKIRDTEGLTEHLLARALGGALLLDEAVKNKVPTVIFLAGTLTSANPSFAQFVAGNGALWALCQFATEHTALNVYYLELGIITGSTMAQQHSEGSQSHLSDQSSIEEVKATLNEVLQGLHPRGSFVKVKP